MQTGVVDFDYPFVVQMHEMVESLNADEEWRAQMSVLLPDELQAIQQWTENAIRASKQEALASKQEALASKREAQRRAEEARQNAERARLSDELAREKAELANFAERKAKALRLVAMNGDLRDLPPEDAPRDQWERLFAKYRV